MELGFKTKYIGGTSARKPRVYFTCHPDDFDTCFEKICNDIFVSQDCAIFYKEDMTAMMPEADWEMDMGRSNLFVVPITLKLLEDKNAVVWSEIAYAKEKHIAILPFIMVQKLNRDERTRTEALYSLDENFGNRQFIEPFDIDPTSKPYEEKLKNYLEIALGGKEMISEIRSAFDGYIFLSYRKMDRHLANELIRKIHSYPEFRDVGIWYDEYLPLGEDYEVNIQNTLAEYPLFMLLVTPNLLEMKLNDKGEEVDNFVTAEEYPMACRMHRKIMAVQMTPLSEEENTTLVCKYKDLPERVDYYDEDLFIGRFREFLTQDKKIQKRVENDPEHDFLMGLAYLWGIDIEVDVERGLEILRVAANSGCERAMWKLYNMYLEGDMVPMDYHESIKWAEKLKEYRLKKYGNDDLATLIASNNPANVYGNSGKHQEALKIHEKTYGDFCRIFGEEHPDTLNSLDNLASTYGALGDSRKALELHEKVYDIRKRMLGEEHPDTLSSLNNLASTYGDLGDRQKALKLHEKVYEIRKRTLEEEHPDTLSSLNNLAVTYAEMRDYKTAQLYCVTVYRTCLDKYGSKFPLTQKANEFLKYLRKKR